MGANFKDYIVATAPLMFLVQRTRTIQGFSIKGEFPDGLNGVIFKLSAGVSFSSWGENVDIHMFPYNEQQTMIEIKSECDLPTQIVDWGKNRHNVEDIMRYLLNGINSMRVDPRTVPQILFK